MKRILFVGLFLFVLMSTTGQVQNVDSLVNILETQKLSSDEKLDIYKDISFFYARNDLKKGLEYATKGLQLAEKEKNKKIASALYRNLSIIYYYQSGFDTSRIYLDKALSLALEIEDKPLEMKIYSELGNLHFLQQNYQTALEFYMKGLSLSENQPDRTHSVILNNIGSIYRTLKNPGRSITFYERALEIAEQLQLDDLKMGIYNGLGTVYADKGETGKAIGYLQEALDISRKLGNKPYEIASLASLSAQFSVIEEYKKAIEYGHMALLIAEKLDSPRDISNVLSVLSEIYLEMEDYKACEIIGLKSWALDSISYETAGPTALTLSVVYIHLGEKQKAENFVRKYFEITTTANEKSIHNSLADMEIKYETEKKEMRIASLEKERRLYIWLGIAGVLFAFSLAIVLWQKIRNARREKHLIATRSVLDGEMGERTRLARDLHDRLSGNLSALKIGLNNNKESLQSIHDKLDSCIEEIRRVAHNLMPASLQFGLKSALEDFAFQFPNVRFHFFGEECRIEERKAFIIYCCGVELVNNSLRHSNAQNINIQLIQSEKYVSLTVQDDGCGFDEKSIIKGLGLKNIYDRVTSCNGNIDTITSPGNGVETTIQLKTGDL